VILSAVQQLLPIPPGQTASVSARQANDPLVLIARVADTCCLCRYYLPWHLAARHAAAGQNRFSGGILVLIGAEPPPLHFLSKAESAWTGSDRLACAEVPPATVHPAVASKRQCPANQYWPARTSNRVALQAGIFARVPPRQGIFRVDLSWHGFDSCAIDAVPRRIQQWHCPIGSQAWQPRIPPRPLSTTMNSLRICCGS